MKNHSTSDWDCNESYAAEEWDESIILRSLLDDFMRYTAEGSQLVDDYYSLLPLVVQDINKSENEESFFYKTFSKLMKCVAHLREHNYKQTFQEYKAMVFDIKNKFNL